MAGFTDNLSWRHTHHYVQGKADIVSGTGRFAAAKGNCTYIGRRVLTASGGAEVYLDFAGSNSR